MSVSEINEKTITYKIHSSLGDDDIKALIKLLGITIVLESDDHDGEYIMIINNENIDDTDIENIFENHQGINRFTKFSIAG